jgi:hypothetical protein
MDLMSSKQVAQYMKTNDMVVLPVGCFEMHGPLVPLACDAFEAWAAAILVAEKWGCLAAPPVYYTFPGASGPWPGTVDVSPRITEEYVKEIALALLKNGFGRVVLLGLHGPLNFAFQPLIRDIYQRTGQVVLAFAPQMMPPDLAEEELGYRGGEDILVLGSMKVLGLHGAYDPASPIDVDTRPAVNARGALAKLGASVPWTFSADHQHTGIRKGLRMDDADKVVRMMRRAVDRMGDLPALFAEHQRQMKELFANPPWKSDDVWSI